MRSVRPFRTLPLLAVLGPISAHAAPVFTGDVPADFIDPLTQSLVDPSGIDVGLAPVFPPGTISGNDMAQLRLFYDPATDILYVGIDTYGIALDVDGDGDPGNASPELQSLSGLDLPDMGGTESFTVSFDIDEDGLYDVNVGVPTNDDITAFQITTFSGNPAAPAFAFGADLSATNPATLYNQGPDAAHRPHQVGLQHRRPVVVAQFEDRADNYGGGVGDKEVGRRA